MSKSNKSVKTSKPNGTILWRGPSQIDGKPIIVIAIGLQPKGSKNSKTGSMLQTYILREDIKPTAAAANGNDVSICGNCKHRGVPKSKRRKTRTENAKGRKASTGRTCYVNLGQGPTVVYKSLKRGIYPVATDIAAVGEKRVVRLGTYGDPAAVPAWVWRLLISRCVAHTGYTHQWDSIGSDYADLCMASADTVAEMEAAHAAGWRTFRVVLNANTVQRFPRLESVCPASAEAGRKLTCIDCKACNGNATGRKGSIVIQAHGGTAVMANVRDRFAA